LTGTTYGFLSPHCHLVPSQGACLFLSAAAEEENVFLRLHIHYSRKQIIPQIKFQRPLHQLKAAIPSWNWKVEHS
jgi:hypothetical protein